MKYRITLTEEQACITQNALEEYFRLRYGQAIDFSNDICSQHCDLSTDNPNHARIFDQFIVRRDAVTDMMRAVFSVAFGARHCLEKPKDCKEAETIWDAIRTARGNNHWNKAFQSGAEPIPDIEVIDA